MNVPLVLTIAHKTSSVLTDLGVLFVNALVAMDYQMDFVKVTKNFYVYI